MTGDSKSLEDMLEELEGCVSSLETGDLTLEQSFERFKQGMELVRQCKASIDTVEKEVVKLMDDGSLEPLDEGETI